MRQPRHVDETTALLWVCTVRRNDLCSMLLCSVRSVVKPLTALPCKPSSRTLVDAIIMLPPLAVPLMSPFRVATVRIISRKSTERTPKALPSLRGVEMRCCQPRRSLGCIPTAVGPTTHTWLADRRRLSQEDTAGHKVTAPPKAGETMCCSPDGPQMLCWGDGRTAKLRQATPTADAAAAAGVQQAKPTRRGAGVRRQTKHAQSKAGCAVMPAAHRPLDGSAGVLGGPNPESTVTLRTPRSVQALYHCRDIV